MLTLLDSLFYAGEYFLDRWAVAVALIALWLFILFLASWGVYRTRREMGHQADGWANAQIIFLFGAGGSIVGLGLLLLSVMTYSAIRFGP